MISWLLALLMLAYFGHWSVVVWLLVIEAVVLTPLTLLYIRMEKR